MAKNTAAVALGSLGGKARAASLSAAQRSAIAKRAGKAPKKARRKRNTDQENWEAERRLDAEVPDGPVCSMCARRSVPVTGEICDECYNAYNTTPRATCAVCPHVDYLTISVVQSKHQCDSCGETFVDEQREKRYFGKAPR